MKELKIYLLNIHNEARITAEEYFEILDIVSKLVKKKRNK